MMDSDLERQIGETMAIVLRERLVELETLEATGDVTDDVLKRLAFVRKLLIRFDTKDGAPLFGLGMDAGVGKGLV